MNITHTDKKNILALLFHNNKTLYTTDAQN